MRETSDVSVIVVLAVLLLLAGVYIGANLMEAPSNKLLAKDGTVVASVDENGVITINGPVVLNNLVVKSDLARFREQQMAQQQKQSSKVEKVDGNKVPELRSGK